VHGRDCSVPIGLVSDKVSPEFRSRKSGGHDQATTASQGSEKARQETVDVEKRHNKKRAIHPRKIVRCFDILDRLAKILVT
jgi:hypothetical protein